MKRKVSVNLLLGLGLVLALGLGVVNSSGQVLAQDTTVQGEMGMQAAVGTAFTYQGRLTQSGNPVTGTCDFQFSLWDAASGGTQIHSLETSATLNDGYFTAVLDFGEQAGWPPVATFAGDARWLAISVRCPAGSGSYTSLSGRVALNPAPYALSLRPGAFIAGDKSGGTVLTARNTTTGDFGAGLKAETNATRGTALIVESRSSSLLQTYGVYATTASRGGTAVYGESTHASSLMDDVAYGGYFKANAFGDIGVYGESSWSQGAGIGVKGKTSAPYGYGVHGIASHASGETVGVYGEAASPNGYGVYSKGNAHVHGNLTWKAKTGYLSIAPAAFQPQAHDIEFTNLGYALKQGGGGICNAQARRRRLSSMATWITIITSTISSSPLPAGSSTSGSTVLRSPTNSASRIDVTEGVQAMKRIMLLIGSICVLALTEVVLAQSGGGYDLTWWTAD